MDECGPWQDPWPYIQTHFGRTRGQKDPNKDVVEYPTSKIPFPCGCKDSGPVRRVDLSVKYIPIIVIFNDFWAERKEKIMSTPTFNENTSKMSTSFTVILLNSTKGFLCIDPSFLEF